jgi:DNA-binding NtrC family response regulator
MPKQPESMKEYFKVLAIDERMMALLLVGLPKRDRFDCLRSLAVKVALKKHDGNKTQTAKYLGVTQRSVREWLNKPGVDICELIEESEQG